mmetsp:Transcript_48844/g.157726  ORF Transcript_48844/g.157726 Transcript_48844/m.157726 type:complete len:277 (+) Transcript_48844:561-1391(+)
MLCRMDQAECVLQEQLRDHVVVPLGLGLASVVILLATGQCPATRCVGKRASLIPNDAQLAVSRHRVLSRLSLYLRPCASPSCGQVLYISINAVADVAQIGHQLEPQQLLHLSDRTRQGHRRPRHSRRQQPTQRPRPGEELWIVRFHLQVAEEQGGECSVLYHVVVARMALVYQPAESEGRCHKGLDILRVRAAFDDDQLSQEEASAIFCAEVFRRLVLLHACSSHTAILHTALVDLRFATAPQSHGQDRDFRPCVAPFLLASIMAMIPLIGEVSLA